MSGGIEIAIHSDRGRVDRFLRWTPLSDDGAQHEVL
jgi:hypothetical protein